jgi:hypothetical protein
MYLLDALADDLTSPARTSPKNAESPGLGTGKVSASDLPASPNSTALDSSSASLPAAELAQMCPTRLNFTSVVEHERACTSATCTASNRVLEYYRNFCLAIPSHAVMPRPSVQGLLQAVFAAEDVELTCEKCQSRSATLEHRLRQLPRVLVVQLNRFRDASGAKVSAPVEISTTLNLGFATDGDTELPAAALGAQIECNGKQHDHSFRDNYVPSVSHTYCLEVDVFIVDPSPTRSATQAEDAAEDSDEAPSSIRRKLELAAAFGVRIFSKCTRIFVSSFSMLSVSLF